MIDVLTHKMIPFTQAADHVPGRPHVATLHRWRLKGVRGRKLATILIGGRRWTSIEAIQAFLKPDDAPDQKPDPKEAGRRAREAGKALQAIGA
jgi:hypothetical protein